MHSSLLLLLILLPLSYCFFFPTSGGGGCCCQQQQPCCCPPPPPPPVPCCGGCGGCGGGYGKRKKREIGTMHHVRGHVSGVDRNGVFEGQCNSQDLSELIKKHLVAGSATSVRSAIYKELDILYPEDSFTVLCVEGLVSYQADAEKYCVEGNEQHNCYVFLTERRQ